MATVTEVAVFGVPGRVFLRRALLVAAGGAFGSVIRYAVGLGTAERLGAAFPWGTISVNVVGAFLIGLIATLADELGAIGPDVRTLLVVGVLGGFTTWSSFSLEAWRLLDQSELSRGTLYVLASLIVSYAAATAGIALARVGR